MEEASGTSREASNAVDGAESDSVAAVSGWEMGGDEDAEDDEEEEGRWPVRLSQRVILRRRRTEIAGQILRCVRYPSYSAAKIMDCIGNLSGRWSEIIAKSKADGKVRFEG